MYLILTFDTVAYSLDHISLIYSLSTQAHKEAFTLQIVGKLLFWAALIFLEKKKTAIIQIIINKNNLKPASQEYHNQNGDLSG